MNRKTLPLPVPVPLLAATGALLLLTGVAALAAPEDSGAQAKSAARLPVERSSLLCPAPSGSDLAETSYTSFTPVVKGAGGEGEASLLPAATDGAEGETDKKKDGKGKKDDEDGKGGKSEKGKGDKDGKGGSGQEAGAEPVFEAKEPGKPVGHSASGGAEPALIGTAEGRLAPGWTVQQSTKTPVGTGRGLSGLACSAPDTDFWFPGVSTAGSRSDYVHLTNPDDSAAVVDVELYGPGGALKSEVGEDIQVRPHASVSVLLSTLTEKTEADVTAHVAVRSGRVSAAVHSADEKTGGDWLAPAGDPAGSLVLPGIPKDATSARLVVFAPGENDADLRLKLATPSGPITPAGHESLHVKAGMTATADLRDVTRGQPGSLLLSPGDKAVPVVAALHVVRGKGEKRESAFLPAAPSVGARASVAENHAKGSVLSLTAPGAAGRVKVTASAGTRGGTPVSKTYRVKSGSTLAVAPPVPQGLKGTYALTVEHLSGGPVHASRLLEAPEDGIPMFTIQTLSDDGGTVAVPEAEEDLSVVQDAERD
ncbi:hypothetical protein SLNWT_2571 [Streptomyces albus]|uniref:Secreted protein n=1 Tax=Streptomyces albus (strain ATCC 21838 / DSM 41398 / FERM P-419 / JCM 4703 / NBRC 107858) TaxID=1081613 RepID=A0A0B5EXW3_STRA4|nr:hypothetical protein SLNWT_2571 [Streptomyces albus]AOU77259.1 hypothetical protein SLNHY_2568 [Streptomyces albus]AYN33035.1 hypothetical protein DUI70_2533 [Streptomyces albus]